ncbi:MAG: sugar phosphate isomerase/epimerase [Kiritimatiellae bacterium]|nr:sugar phosphate isomerase/epimerase [Kiritimatiellia bacterium]
MFSLSTCWFAGRDADGSALVDEALKLGFGALELGYALPRAAAEAILKRAAAGDIAISSVHAYAPAPADRPGHPELYSLADTDETARAEAVEKTIECLDFAATAGAPAMVVHAGRIKPAARRWLLVHTRIANDSADGFLYRWNLKRMVQAREKGIGAALESLRRSLAELLPRFEAAGVRLALENLPSYDAIPSPEEADALAREFGASPAFALWYDMGHGQVMENAGYGNGLEYARRHLRRLAGAHIHDVVGPAGDHQAPGRGGIDFAAFDFLATLPSLVFEPSAGVLVDDLVAGREMLERTWRK